MVDAFPDERHVIRKLTIPDIPDLYSALVTHKRVARVVASFSRALTEDLGHSMSDAEFNTALARSIDEIYRASVVNV